MNQKINNNKTVPLKSQRTPPVPTRHPTARSINHSEGEVEKKVVSGALLVVVNNNTNILSTTK